MTQPPSESGSSTKIDDQALNQVYNLTKKISSQLLLLSDSAESTEPCDLYKQPETSILTYIQKLSADSTSKILDKLESLGSLIETSSKQCDELCELVTSQDNPASDRFEDEKSARESLLSGIKLQREALATINANHLDILLLHSFQDLVSQAAIRAVAAVDSIKQDLDLVESAVDSMQGIDGVDREFASPAAEETNEELDSEIAPSQLGQDDVDSLFASIRQDG